MSNIKDNEIQIDDAILRLREKIGSDNKQINFNKKNNKIIKNNYLFLMKSIRFVLICFLFFSITYFFAQLIFQFSNEGTSNTSSNLIQKNNQNSNPEFLLNSAQYEEIISEFGKSLDISINISNVGNSPGHPKKLIIELIDVNENVLLTWPIIVSESIIKPNKNYIYKAKVIEPPKTFEDIRVTMN